MAKFQIQPTLGNTDEAFTVRFGAGTGSGNNWTDTEAGKAVKLVGESRYDLAAVGDPIEGFVVALNGPTSDGYTVGTVQDEGMVDVTADGLQATPGTGVVAVGDYVVASTATAKGTVLALKAKVVKATAQPFATPADLATAALQIKNAMFGWRVVSLGTAGTGAVGTTVIIQRVNS